MESLIPLIVSLLSHAVPAISGSAPAIAEAIKTVVAITPVVMSGYSDLKPIVGRVITALKNDPATTDQQIAVLEAAEVLLDTDFDAVANAALAEDAAAAAKT